MKRLRFLLVVVLAFLASTAVAPAASGAAPEHAPPAVELAPKAAPVSVFYGVCTMYGVSLWEPWNFEAVYRVGVTQSVYARTVDNLGHVNPVRALHAGAYYQIAAWVDYNPYSWVILQVNYGTGWLTVTGRTAVNWAAC